MPDSCRLITWNVARRRAGLVEQATALARRSPDIVALQELTRGTLPLWRRACALMGLEHVRSSLDAAPLKAASARRSLGVLIASRGKLTDTPHSLSVPWPESALWAEIEAGEGALEVLCVHVPNAANGAIKPQTLRAMRDALEIAGPGPRVVCGDLNTPRRELADGEVTSFARDRYGRLRADRGPEWDAAELGVVPGLRELGYRDAYRSLHGYARSDPSWTWQRIAGHSGGWRLDHAFTSAELEPLACAYHHAWRDDGLSDHSALEIDFRRSRHSATSSAR